MNLDGINIIEYVPRDVSEHLYVGAVVFVLMCVSIACAIWTYSMDKKSKAVILQGVLVVVQIVLLVSTIVKYSNDRTAPNDIRVALSDVESLTELYQHYEIIQSDGLTVVLREIA